MQTLAGCYVPNMQAAIPSSGDESLAIGGENHVGDATGVAGHAAERPAAGNIPKLDGDIIAAHEDIFAPRGQQDAIRGNRQGATAIAVRNMTAELNQGAGGQHAHGILNWYGRFLRLARGGKGEADE